MHIKASKEHLMHELTLQEKFAANKSGRETNNVPVLTDGALSCK